MNLKLDKQITENFPGLKIGAILVKGFDNTKKVSAVSDLLRGIVAQTAKELENQEIKTLPTVVPWLEAYKKFGVNRKKRKPAHVALLERIKGGSQMPEINLLVDVYNYFSIKHKRPIGGEDLDWLCGDLSLRYTKPGEPFRALGSIDVKQTKEGEVAYVDDAGVTCRYWNYRECERTKFTNKTVNAVLLMEDISGMPDHEFQSLLEEFADLVKKYVGGDITTAVLDQENAMLDLGIQGRKNFDDSKIPRQEKAHYANKNKTSQKEKSKTKQKQFLDDTGLLKTDIQNLLQNALKKSYPQITEIPHVEYPASEDHGDYATNIALKLSKQLQKNPREIAQSILENLPENNIIGKTEIAGPGFINLFLSHEFLKQNLNNPITPTVQPGRKILVEYSAPNIAKPLGVHHLLSTVIGQTISNLFRELNFETTSINYVGDWGTQFGKLTYAYKQWGNRGVIEKDPIAELLKLYVDFHNKAEEDPTLEDKGREEFKKFEQGDPENREIWQWIVTESLKDINKTYDKLGGIHFDLTQGESFLEDKMQAILDEGIEKALFTEGKQGALVVTFPEEENLPTTPVQKKDGATLYITRDIANLKYRVQHFKPEKIIYVVDHSQSLHFKQFFSASKKLGHSQDQPVHVSFGRMSMKDKKMSTRKGNIVLLNDVIDEAEKRAIKIIQEKNPNLPNIKQVAQKVSIAAIKYNILSQNRTTDIVFDWDKMLSFDGNSAPYLLYTYARIQSILRKSQQPQDGTIKDPENIKQLTSTLLRKMVKYPEILVQATREYKPNILCTYLFELAQKLNSYYNSVPILKAENDREQRLQLVSSSTKLLQKGLRILGVDTVDQM